jgi:glutamate-1-semialdehyde 2,1-aminomutase
MDINQELFHVSQQFVPGGVHSPVRSFKDLPMSPRFFSRGEGAYLFDLEENSYIDFCMSFGPLILGHRNPEVEQALIEGVKRGWSYGTCEPYSLKLSQLIVEKIPFIEQIRFVNSGTEAVMTALRLARGVTGRDKIIKFSGCYHGHSDSMLIKAGSGLAGTTEASSKGVPRGVFQDTIILELGDNKALEQCFEKFPQEIAAVIIEPLPANNGLLIQQESFLKDLRKITQDHHALLIFDEVISGLRIGFGGMSDRLNINPDLVTYGKIIGAGLPVGAVAGGRKIMEHLAPLGEVYQAGTLSANPLAMAAGIATLAQLTPKNYQTIEDNAQNIIELFSHWLQQSEFSHFRAIRYGSLFWFVPEEKEISSLKDIPQNLGQKFSPLFSELLRRGIYLSPNAFEVGFISLAHNKKVLSQLEERLFR